MTQFFPIHKELLDRAVEAIRARTYWSAYPETPSGRIYGEAAKAAGEAAFNALLGQDFELDQPTDGRKLGQERSPYGRELGVRYHAASASALIMDAEAAGVGWGAASPEERVGIALEILHRLNRDSFLMAHAVMHTTGQAFVMAFQAGGPHAQDRALEAVAYAWEAMQHVPGAVRWAKPTGKTEVVLDKTFRIVPRGVALVIGCGTFPTWNGYPGLFASLVTGNPVIVKPHPRAILPLALAVRTGREVLHEAGFDPNVLLLAPDEADAPITEVLAADPRVQIIDFTGGPDFGAWLRQHARHAELYTEEAGVNAAVIDGTADFAGMCANLAFSLALYSGQMCTAPQNLFVPEAGIVTDQGRKSFDEVAAGITGALDELLGEPDRAAGVLGAIHNPQILERIQEARGLGTALRDSTPVSVPGYPDARTASPLVIGTEAASEDFAREWFGPISFIVKTADTRQSLSLATAAAWAKGAVTASVYSTDAEVLEAATEAFARVGVALSCNLTGAVHVNQSAAFSDFHVSGANPAGNACLTDPAFVARRFRVVTIRRPAAA